MAASAQPRIWGSGDLGIWGFCGAALLVVLLALLSPPVHAQVPAPGAGELPASDSFLERHLDLTGYLRLRFDVMENLDLNRGPTPTTRQPIFPVAPGDPDAAITSANMRLRLDPSIRVGWGVSVHARIDILDNLVLGSTPEGLPASGWAPMSGGASSMAAPSAGVNSTSDSVKVKRAWGEVILPIGVLSAGRMGSVIDWGTGFFINSGNCLDCDLGDVGDRVAFAMPILGHVFAFAFDFGASGPTSASLRTDAQPFNVDNRDDVLSWALAFTNYQTPRVVERYRRAGRLVLQYGAVASVRTQQWDVPAYYLTGDRSRTYSDKDMVRRGLLAFAADLWFGMRYKGWTVDVEGAVVLSSIDNASLMPGTEFLQTVTARQFGGVARVQHRWTDLQLTLEVGLASGDSAPGFGAYPPLNQYTVQPGDLDGPQVSIPGDTTVNNFRFNPDYHVDQILWRRIIGTVTDAFYARPSARYRLLRGMWLDAALIASSALEAGSTPSGERPLGVELDLGLSYRLELGFEARLSYAVLFPLSGMKNLRLGLDPEPAHLFHAIIAYRL